MYKIIRVYKKKRTQRTIETGLTLEEAQMHCKDPETASHTAIGANARRITRRNGPWFDAYEQE